MTKDEIKKIDHKDEDQILSRRQARRFALQVLFCNEFLNENISEVSERVARTVHYNIDDFSLEIILSTAQNKRELDRLILRGLVDRNMGRVPVLEKVLIRMALSELINFSDIPIEVTLNEAVDLSKEFISLKSSRFINGILDTLVKKLEIEGKINKSMLARLPSSVVKGHKPVKDLKL